MCAVCTLLLKLKIFVFLPEALSSPCHPQDKDRGNKHALLVCVNREDSSSSSNRPVKDSAAQAFSLVLFHSLSFIDFLCSFLVR